MPAVIPLIAAGISAYASYKSASKAASASEHASDTSLQSNREAQQFLKERLQRYDEQMEPYRQFGLSGLGQLSSLLGGGGGGNPPGTPRITPQSDSSGGGGGGDDLTKDTITPQLSRVAQLMRPSDNSSLTTLRNLPGYQFAYNTGMDATQSSPFLRRLSGGSGTMAALSQFGHGLADQSYQEWINDFLEQAKLGLPAQPS